MKAFLRKNRWYILINIFSILVITVSLWSVFKPVALPDPVTTQQIADARTLGLFWLSNNFDGQLFRYEFDPELDRTPSSSNALRQLMASRVAAAEAKNDPVFEQIHTDNLEYVFAEWYKENDGDGYVLYEDKSKLGANAMLLRTLVASPDFDTYATEAARVAAGMIALQNEDGSFNPWYVEPDYEYDANYLLHFYSGEAILALIEYYEKISDEKVFVAIEKAADFYINKYSEEIEENYHPAYVPWQTMSFYHLYQITGEQRYVDAIFTMNDRLIELLDKRIYPGRFYKRELETEGQQAPHASSDAVYLEGLLYAYELAQDGGDVERAVVYKEAIELAATRLVNLQFKADIDTFDAKPITYIGSIPIREGNPRIRVDTIQHTLDAFEKYLTVFGEAD